MEIAIIGALISALGFGIANIVIKKALSNTSIAQTLFSSMLSGTIFLFILVLFKGIPSSISLELIGIFLLFAIGEVCLYLSLYKAFEAANVTVASGVISVYPILSSLFAIVFLGEVIGINKILYIILMVVGAILISIDWSSFKGKRFSIKNFTKGLPWAILCLLLHAIYFPALGGLTASGNWEFKLLGIRIFVVMILTILFVIIQKQRFELTRKKVYAGILLGFLELVGWVGLSYASSNTIGIIAIIVALGSSSPLVTAIGARFYLKERLHTMQYVGIIIVVIGLTLIAIP